MSIAYLISWNGTAKPSDFQIETFPSRTDAVTAQGILEHKHLDRTAKAIDEVGQLAGSGSAFLVALYNVITGESQKGFHDASTGRKKVWDALTTKYPDPNPVQPDQAPSNLEEGAPLVQDENAQPGVNNMATKKAAKAPKAKKVKAEKKAKGPGVIDTIVDILKAGGGTVEEISAKLAKKFSDKDADGLKATVKIQVNRLSKSKDEGGRGLKVKKEAIEGSNEKHYSA